MLLNKGFTGQTSIYPQPEQPSLWLYKKIPYTRQRKEGRKQVGDIL